MLVNASPALLGLAGSVAATAVAGSANNTLEAMPDPADTPADADALRDDITTNLLPPLRNNIADICTQINALNADLLDLKQLVNSVIDDLQLYGLLQ